MHLWDSGHIFLEMHKSMRSGILFMSVGQYVGEYGEVMFRERLFINKRSCRPFGVIRREPHEVCLALKSPHGINLCPRDNKNLS